MKTIGIQVYYSPKVAVNILSYSKLQDTHVCTFIDESFRAVPKTNGPVLIFWNINGHYTMDVTDTVFTLLISPSTPVDTLSDRLKELARQTILWRG